MKKTKYTLERKNGIHHPDSIGDITSPEKEMSMKFTLKNPRDIANTLSSRINRHLKKDDTLVLLYLLHCKQGQGFCAEDKDISELLELSLPQTRRCLQKLQQQGLLYVTQSTSIPSSFKESDPLMTSKQKNRKNWGNILSILNMDTCELTPLQWRWFDEIRARLDPNRLPLDDMMALATDNEKWDTLFSLIAEYLQRSPFSSPQESPKIST